MKNSWSFDLIDQMGKLIRDDGKGGVNFQKVSCVCRFRGDGLFIKKVSLTF